MRGCAAIPQLAANVVGPLLISLAVELPYIVVVLVVVVDAGRLTLKSSSRNHREKLDFDCDFSREADGIRIYFRTMIRLDEVVSLSD